MTKETSVFLAAVLSAQPSAFLFAQNISVQLERSAPQVPAAVGLGGMTARPAALQIAPSMDLRLSPALPGLASPRLSAQAVLPQVAAAVPRQAPALAPPLGQTATAAERKYFGAASDRPRENDVQTALQGLQLPLPAGLENMSPSMAAASLREDFLARINVAAAPSAGRLGSRSCDIDPAFSPSDSLLIRRAVSKINLK